MASLLIAFVAFVFRITPSLADERLEVIASLAIVVVAAAAFVIIGMVEGTMAFQFGRPHTRELLSYLLLGMLSLASGLYLAVSDEASLQIIALVAASHPLLFGLAQIRMAQHLERHPAYRRGLLLCGLIEIGLGFTLIAGSLLSNERTAMLLGYVAILSLLQLLPLLFYSVRAASHHR
jgi:uncharacterized membrane protein HdeD (DUF308 family)